MPLLKKNELPDINSIARNWAKHNGTSLRSISRKLKKSENYLHQILIKRDVRPSVLIALSDFLGVNLFEYYLELLAPPVRATLREKQLQQELEQLQNELQKKQAECERLWEKLGR